MSGCSCQPSALLAGVSTAAGPVINGPIYAASLVRNAVVGGLGSVAGGGKFANGAITGAFGHMFNEAGNNLQRGYGWASQDAAAHAALAHVPAKWIRFADKDMRQH